MLNIAWFPEHEHALSVEMAVLLLKGNKLPLLSNRYFLTSSAMLYSS